MWCESASGVMLPPITYFINPKLSMRVVHEEVWKDLFMGALPSNKLMLGYNLPSHFNMRVMEKAWLHNIYLLMIPSSGTHLFQPLDVVVFGSMKVKWKIELTNWPKESHTKNLPKEHFLLLLKRLIKACKPIFTANLENGFRTCGLYPVSCKEILRKLRRIIPQ